MNTKHFLGLAAAGVLVAALMIPASRRSAAQEADEAPPQQPRPATPFDAAPRNRASEGGLVVPSVLVTLAEQRSVPARESGVLATVAVEEGHVVEEEQLLARIDDAESQLDKRRAEIELQIARRKSENNIKVRAAQGAAAVAQSEYKRTLDARRRFPQSVTDSDLDRDRLTAERAELEVEQAEHDFGVEELTAQLKENELAVAVRNVERRQILSPISGVVVEVNRRRGEWVEPGEEVFRVLRIDRLRAEGFLSADQVRGDLVGSRAVLRVNLPGQPNAEFEGKVTFVSPELDPLNNQVRFWAEIENRDRLLRPGLQAALVIHSPATTAARD